MLPFTNRETRQHFKVFYSDFSCYVDYDVLCFVYTFIFNLDLIKNMFGIYVHKHGNVANFVISQNVEVFMFYICNFIFKSNKNMFR